MRILLVYISIAIAYSAHVVRFAITWLTGGLPMRGVRVIIISGDSVCLVRNAYAPGLWTLPGGGVDKGESVISGGMREVKEETGIELASIEGELGTYQGKMGKRDIVSVLIASHHTTEISYAANIEILAARFFPLNNLPRTLTRGNRKRIEEYQNGERNIVNRLWEE